MAVHADVSAKRGSPAQPARRLLKTTCAALLLSAAAMAQTTVAAQTAATAPATPLVRKQLGDGLYWLSDGAYNTLFLVSNEGVIVVDPLPTLGRRYLDAIAAVTDQPVRYIVYSHEHSDHIGGAYLFPPGAQIVAQRRVAELLAQRADPRRPAPTLVVDQHYELKLGNQTLVLDYAGENHAPGNLFIYAPRQKVLMLVDVVYPGYMPYPGLGVASDIGGYIAAHEQILRYDFDTLVAGHVDRLGTRADVEDSRTFALALRSTAEQLVQERPFPAWLAAHPVEAKASGWFAHDDYETALIDACYTRLHDTWAQRLLGTERFLRSHCRAMVVALAISLPPADGVHMPTQEKRP
jgi:glyoxylase-like metal-dependent hydrolase (beta-lactamase superfamily II)